MSPRLNIMAIVSQRVYKLRVAMVQVANVVAVYTHFVFGQIKRKL